MSDQTSKEHPTGIKPNEHRVVSIPSPCKRYASFTLHSNAYLLLTRLTSGPHSVGPLALLNVVPAAITAGHNFSIQFDTVVNRKYPVHPVIHGDGMEQVCNVAAIGSVVLHTTV